MISYFMSPNGTTILSLVFTKITLVRLFIIINVSSLREAIQSKKRGNLGNGQNRGGVIKKSKKSQVSVGKSSKLGGGLRKL